jgi:hypothetical protein
VSEEGPKPNQCCVAGCERPRYARQAECEAHYRRRLRNGSIDADRPVGAGATWKECSIEGCTRQAVSRGWCHGHFQRWARTGDVAPDRPLGRQVNFECSVEGCDRDAISKGLCRTHYRRLLRVGDPLADKPVMDRIGRHLNHGYWIVPVPRQLRHLTDGRPNEAEHRLVMAKTLGRALYADESVHHRNGDRRDNRAENLELWSRWQPSGQRVSDKIGWAIELLRRYSPETMAQTACDRLRTTVSEDGTT